MAENNETEFVQIFEAQFDHEGVYFYQAYNYDIANWALEQQKFGGPLYNITRMTWIKPSFAWVLYRSGYGKKKNQTRILKIKLSHDTVASELLFQLQNRLNLFDRNFIQGILSECRCGHGGGGGNGRVQWDPARDILEGEKGEPKKKYSRHRAIQIGVKGKLNEFYVAQTISIEDVTELAHKVCQAHASKTPKEEMAKLLPELPEERSYKPSCSDEVLIDLGMLPGETAKAVARIGLGKAIL